MSKSRLITLFTMILLVFGLIMVGSASVVDAARDFSDKWYYFKLQTAWAGFGLILFFIASNIPHQKLQKYALPLLMITFVLLLIVLIPGIGLKLLGARRWINLGLFSFQPSEIAKLTLGIYFSYLLVYREHFRRFVFVLTAAIVLIMLQPDLGTAVVIALVGSLTYFGSGGELSKLLFVGVIGLILGTLLIIFSPYRFSRVKTFFDYSRDPQGSSYQIRQALLALGSGGTFGLGLGQSRQKYDYLPEATTDSIFAVIGEELGLVGTIVVVTIFLLLSLIGFDIARTASPGFSANLAIAMTSLVVVQAFINASSLTALLPLTGIPLSFISYGGSSLVTVLSAMGILVNISKKSGK